MEVFSFIWAVSITVPHQPRLDWELSLAAQGTYQQHPWLINLCYRLLTGEADVLKLINGRQLPFDTPPKHLRISRYQYKFVCKFKHEIFCHLKDNFYFQSANLNDPNWWTKSSNRHAYMPVVTKQSLGEVLKLEQITLPKSIQEATKDKYSSVKKVLDWLSKTLTSPWLVARTQLVILALFYLGVYLNLRLYPGRYPLFKWWNSFDYLLVAVFKHRIVIDVSNQV